MSWWITWLVYLLVVALWNGAALYVGALLAVIGISLAGLGILFIALVRSRP